MSESHVHTINNENSSTKWKHLRELYNKINGLALLMEMARLLNYANFGYLWGHVKS
jgi:hypothetical protein